MFSFFGVYLLLTRQSKIVAQCETHLRKPLVTPIKGKQKVFLSIALQLLNF